MKKKVGRGGQEVRADVDILSINIHPKSSNQTGPLSYLSHQFTGLHIYLFTFFSISMRIYPFDFYKTYSIEEAPIIASGGE